MLIGSMPHQPEEARCEEPPWQDRSTQLINPYQLNSSQFPEQNGLSALFVEALGPFLAVAAGANPRL